MINYLKRIFYILLIIILLYCFSVSIIKILMFFSTDTCELVEVSPKKPVLYGNEKCFMDDEYIYLANTKKGNIYIFDFDGAFNYTLHIPTNGGTIWVKMCDVLYVYAVRKHVLTKISGEEYNQIDAYYYSPNAFYDSIECPDDRILNLSGRTVTFHNGSEDYKIILEAKYDVFSLELSTFLSAISFLSILLLIRHKRKVLYEDG